MTPVIPIVDIFLIQYITKNASTKNCTILQINNDLEI